MHGWLHEWQPLSKVRTSEDVVKLPAACTMELYTNRPAGYLSLGWVARWNRFHNTDELGKIDASLLSISPFAVPIEDNLFIHTNLVYSSEWALPLFSATGAHDNRPVNGHYLLHIHQRTLSLIETPSWPGTLASRFWSLWTFCEQTERHQW
jgi:hypothetical protein